MFVGQYSHNIDSKGRLAVPAKFRSELKKAFVTHGLDNCLFLYPQKTWEKKAVELASMPENKANNRGYARLFLAGAMEVEIDKQGRLIVPEFLRKYAGLKKTVIITGLYDRLEIWDEEAWNKYRSEMEKNSNAIAEALSNPESK